MVDLQEGVHSQAGVDEDDGVLPPLQTTHLTLEPQTGSCAAVLLTHTHLHIGVSCDSAVGAPCCGGSPASAGRSLWTPAPYGSSSGCVPPSLYLWLDPHLHWCSWLETADSDTHTHTDSVQTWVCVGAWSVCVGAWSAYHHSQRVDLYVGGAVDGPLGFKAGDVEQRAVPQLVGPLHLQGCLAERAGPVVEELTGRTSWC